jgi:hypothetical protein
MIDNKVTRLAFMKLMQGEWPIFGMIAVGEENRNSND